MTTIHLMCGLPCSGKTTLAKQLEKEHNALRLTPDEWHIRLFGQDAQDPKHDWRHDTIEDLLWNVAAAEPSASVAIIPPEKLTEWLTHFEAPDADEMSRNGTLAVFATKTS